MTDETKLCIDGLCAGIRRAAQGLAMKSLKMLWIYDRDMLMDCLPYVVLRESWPLFETSVKIVKKARGILDKKRHNEALECISDFIRQVVMRNKDRDPYGLMMLVSGSWYSYETSPLKILDSQWKLAKYGVEEPDKFWSKVEGSGLQARSSKEFLSLLKSYYDTKTIPDEARRLVISTASKVLTQRRIVIPPISDQRRWGWDNGAISPPSTPPSTMVVPRTPLGMIVAKRVASTLSLPVKDVVFTWMSSNDNGVFPVEDTEWFYRYYDSVSKLGISGDTSMRSRVAVHLDAEARGELDRIIGVWWNS